MTDNECLLLFADEKGFQYFVIDIFSLYLIVVRKIDCFWLLLLCVPFSV